jgi:RimJ/RimL family protein N-acetyltransferase
VPFDYQPVLRSALLELRPLRADDRAALFAAAADPAIWEQHPDRDRWREDVFRAYFDEQLASGGALLVRDAVTGEVIGSSRFHAYEPERSEVEIGWTFLVRSRWGGPANRELKRLMLGHAFRFVDVVAFRVHVGNARSRRAVEKIGGREAGPARDDAGRAMVAYRLRASQFDA